MGNRSSGAAAADTPRCDAVLALPPEVGIAEEAVDAKRMVNRMEKGCG